MSEQESFISHLVELRQRLVRAVGAVLAIFVVLFLYPGSGYIYDLLALPLMNALPEGSKMIATGVIDFGAKSWMKANTLPNTKK